LRIGGQPGFVRRVAGTPHYDAARADAAEPAVIAVSGIGPVRQKYDGEQDQRAIFLVLEVEAGEPSCPGRTRRRPAAELDRSVTQLDLKGVLILGRPGATFLDDPRYAPVLGKLDDLTVPLYLHPGDPLPEVQQVYYGGFP
jgi:hypothetical protein